jgi:hypothetical protein
MTKKIKKHKKGDKGIIYFFIRKGKEVLVSYMGVQLPGLDVLYYMLDA